MYLLDSKSSIIWRCRLRKIMNRIASIVVFSLGLLFTLLIFTYFAFIPLGNNYQLHKQEKTLAAIALPAKTQLVEKQSVCGKLNGNGNGINYLATILIKSDLSLNELKEYYSNYEVVAQSTPQLKSEYLEHDTILYTKLKKLNDFSGYYVVCSYQSAKFGSIWELDLRGH